MSLMNHMNMHMNLNMHWCIGAEVLWCSEVNEGKSCIWIWTCIFEYDDWSPWLMNTMMLGLKDWIYLMINALLMFLPCDILAALAYIYIYVLDEC